MTDSQELAAALAHLPGELAEAVIHLAALRDMGELDDVTAMIRERRRQAQWKADQRAMVARAYVPQWEIVKVRDKLL